MPPKQAGQRFRLIPYFLIPSSLIFIFTGKTKKLTSLSKVLDFIRSTKIVSRLKRVVLYGLHHKGNAVFVIHRMNRWYIWSSNRKRIHWKSIPLRMEKGCLSNRSGDKNQSSAKASMGYLLRPEEEKFWDN